jgi:recyclin-1
VMRLGKEDGRLWGFEMRLVSLDLLQRDLWRLYRSLARWDERGRDASVLRRRDALADDRSTRLSPVITPPPLTSSDPAVSNSSPLPINFPSHGPKSSASGFADFSASARTPASPPLDEFGDFVNVPVNEAGGGATGGQQSLMEFDKPVPLPSNRAATGGRSNGFFAFSPVKTTESQMPSSSSAVRKPKRPYRKLYQAYHTSLMPTLQPLMTIPAPSPSQTLSLLFPASLSSTPAAAVLQSAVLVSLLTFLTPQVQPLDRWKVIRQSVLAAADRFDAACLIGFEGADEKGDEAAMKLWASAGWNVWVLATSGSGSTGLQRRRVEEWEVGRVWIERRELFYEGGSMWDPLKNILCVNISSVITSLSYCGRLTTFSPFSTPPMVPEAQLNFTPMDAFISHVEAAIASSGELAMRVFPPTSQVLRMFTERVISDVIGESYVQPLLERARESGLDIFLRASAAVYAVTGRIVEAVEKAGGGSVQSKEVEDLM